MKKVTILSLHLGFGGIEKSVAALANLLCEKYKVEIVCVYKLYDKSVFDLDERVKVKYLLKNLKPNHKGIEEAKKSKNIFKLIKEYSYGAYVLFKRRSSMIKFISKCRSNIIISTRDIFNEWLGFYGRKDVLKIGWEHNHYHGDMKYADNIVKSAKNLDYFVLVSKDLKSYYSKHLSKYGTYCFYIPNIIDDLPKSLAPLTEKRLISVGRLNPEKGYLDLLKVFKLVHEEHKDWVLDIIGDGRELDSINNYIEKNKLNNFVTMHGFQDKKYIDKMLNKSSIYLMTSYTESFGIVLIEAMSHGVPCIAFDSAEGAKELINSGDNGYLIHNRNFEMMAKKVGDFINDFDKRKEIGKNSRNFAKQFTGDKIVLKWIDLIEKGEVDEK